MVKTMFTALFLGALSLGVAQVPFTTAPAIAPAPITPAPPPVYGEFDKAQCAVDGAAAMSDLSDAAMFTWAASKRCGNAAESQLKCEIDITSAAQGATKMIATIVGAVAACGAISTESAECAAAVTGLTSAAAGLAAASGGIVDACPNSLNLPDGSPTGTAQQTNLGLCIIDAKGAMTSLFSASKYLSQAADCKQDGDCSDTAVNIISALADMGANLAGSVNDCNSVKGDGNANAGCASGGLALVSALTGVAQAGEALKGKCTAGASRLYQNRKVATGSSSLTVALAAFLPIAAVLSFVVGRRTRSRTEPERDVELTLE